MRELWPHKKLHCFTHTCFCHLKIFFVIVQKFQLVFELLFLYLLNVALETNQDFFEIILFKIQSV